MEIIVETGFLVNDANSYVSLEDARAYAGARASDFPADDDAGKAALFRAMDYLEAQRDRYQGRKVEPATQSLQWPRRDVVIDGWQVPITHIPKELKAAQIQLAIESAAGVDLMPTGDGREVIREKVDVLETQYAPNGNGGALVPVFAKVDSLLDALFGNAGFGLKVMRY